MTFSWNHRTISFRFCRFPGDDPQKIKMTRILEELINLTVKEKGVCWLVLSFTEKCIVVVISIFRYTGFKVKDTLSCTNSIVVKSAKYDLSLIFHPKTPMYALVELFRKGS